MNPHHVGYMAFKLLINLCCFSQSHFYFHHFLELYFQILSYIAPAKISCPLVLFAECLIATWHFYMTSSINVAPVSKTNKIILLFERFSLCNIMVNYIVASHVETIIWNFLKLVWFFVSWFFSTSGDWVLLW